MTNSMFFTRVAREDHSQISFSDSAEFYNRPCDTCHRAHWQYCVEGVDPEYADHELINELATEFKDHPGCVLQPHEANYHALDKLYGASFDYINKLTQRDEGYALVCVACWKQYFAEFPCLADCQ